MVRKDTMSDDEKSLDDARDKKEETKEEKVEETKEEVKKEKVEEKKESFDKAQDKEVKEEKKESLENTRDKKAAPSGKFKDLIKSIEELSVLELAELVKELEERFGVSAAAPMMAMGAMPTAGAAAAGADTADEKANYTIHLADSGAQKIAVIKVIREIRQDLGLKEAKDLVDGAPKDIKADVPKEEAEIAKKKLEEAGAKVELK